MPIAIRETFEPFSRAATGPGTGSGGSILIESEAYRLLKQEAERYVRGEVRGRSFLIAGHRGSGKTTMVLHVCQELRNLPPARDRRVLPVFLHGPNLLPDLTRRSLGRGKRAPEKKEEEKKAEAAAEQGTAATETPKDGAPHRPPGALSEDETENALIQIALELYRALAREVTLRFRNAVQPEAGRPATRGELARLELAAQLEAELDRCPEPARLREIWARCGFLTHGILFSGDEAEKVRPDQGFRELLALSSACEMYRRISGSLTRETGSKAEAARESSAGARVDTKGQDLIAPIAALLTGGLVGVATASAGALTASFTGLLTGLGAAAVFKVSSSRSRKRSYTEESKFVRDLTVATLDREIPVIVDRCLDAGLVPLFVVDELDKVQVLSKRISSLVRRLKKLVAERAFFCFLADRQYFEEMHTRTRDQAYPIEYTYFTHDLFVVFDHRDFHEYLLRAITPAEPIARFDPEQSTESATLDFDGEATPDEIEDCRILRYILLHRAKMHTIDLRRLLARLSDDRGMLDVPPGAWRSRAHLCDLVIQVAVEMVLEGPAMRERLQREPSFRRLAHDALYYPSRLWQDKKYKLDLTEGKEEKFGRWLVSRMGCDARNSASPSLAAPADAEPKTDLTVPDTDRRFLFERVRELARLLAHPNAFAAGFREWASASGPAISADLRLTWASMEPHVNLILPLLHSEEHDGEHFYRWRLDYSGLELRSLPTEESIELALGAGAEPQRLVEADRVLAFGRLFHELQPVNLTTLTSELRILSISPAWAEVDRALKLIELARGGQQVFGGDAAGWGQALETRQTIHDFHELLQRECEMLALALFCGAVLGTATPARKPFGERLLAGLRAVARTYRLEKLTYDQRLQVFRNLTAQLEAESKEDLPNPPDGLNSLEPQMWTLWLDQLRSHAEGRQVVDSTLAGLVATAWLEWEHRLAKYLSQGTQQFEPSRADLWCAAAGLPPANLLVPDLTAMRLNDWSHLFFAAVTDPERVSGSSRWLAVPALFAMGFRFRKLRPVFQAIGFKNRKGAEPSGEDEMESFHLDLAGFAPRKGRNALLYRQSQGSLTSGWMPPKRGGLLALTRDQLWNSVLVDPQGKQPPLLATLELDLIVVELGPDDEPETNRGKRSRQTVSQSGELRATLGSMLTFSEPERLGHLVAEGGRRPALLYLAADSTVPVPPDAPVLYAPSDADEVLAKAPPPPSGHEPA